ncbi:MAG: hypothetical protein OSB09_11935 [Planctomycetota bacterium]|nr:hypothetical protein [Planctomycetota bacterium]
MAHSRRSYRTRRAKTLLCLLVTTMAISSDTFALPNPDDLSIQVQKELDRVASREEQVRYRGQYAALVPLGTPAAQLLLTMLRDEDRLLSRRRQAANALHDVATTELIDALQQTMEDLLLEPWVETEIGLLLARLGERQMLDRWIGQLRRITDQPPTTVTLTEILEGLGKLGDLQFRSADLAGASTTHQRRIALLEDLIPRLPERLQPRLIDEMQAIHYNLACCLALSGKVDEAFEATQISLLSSTIRITMVQVDGDLRALREDPRWSDWLLSHSVPEEVKEVEPKEK